MRPDTQRPALMPAGRSWQGRAGVGPWSCEVTTVRVWGCQRKSLTTQRTPKSLCVCIQRCVCVCGRLSITGCIEFFNCVGNFWQYNKDTLLRSILHVNYFLLVVTSEHQLSLEAFIVSCRRCSCRVYRMMAWPLVWRGVVMRTDTRYQVDADTLKTWQHCHSCRAAFGWLVWLFNTVTHF